MTVLVGAAMMAMPVEAVAKDHNKFDNSRARFFTPARNVGPVVVNRHDFRHGGMWVQGPAVVDGHKWKGYKGWKNDHDADDGYGNSGYYPAPVYAAPVDAA